MNIKVRDLKQTETIENKNKLMVLVDDDLNLVKNITKEEFLTNVISTIENNALVQESDGNLYVNTSEIVDSIQAMDDKFTEQIGDLADLTTEDKTNLVAAINEAASTGGDGGGRNVGEIISSTLPLTDAGLHLLDGSLISGTGAYADFVTYIAGLVSTYPDLFETEANWQTAVTTYGVCGKFVYDSVNNTVRLPKITGIVEATTDLTALGDLVQAGLPNITGDGFVIKASQTPTGLLNTTGQRAANSASGNIGVIDWATFNASRSNSIYGNSTTVQPQAIKVLYYIVIATSTKTDIQVDIDEIATDLNGKADTDLSNVPTSKGILSESYVNGTSWYRVYSDGWCEQGGHIQKSSSSVQVTFLKPFINTKYTLLSGMMSDNSNNSTYRGVAIAYTSSSVNYEHTSNSGFTVYKPDILVFDWEAKGYIN